MLILFKPDVQRTKSSLSFSNFIIVKTRAIKKQKGINFVNTLERVRKSGELLPKGKEKKKLAK